MLHEIRQAQKEKIPHFLNLMWELKKEMKRSWLIGANTQIDGISYSGQ